MLAQSHWRSLRRVWIADAGCFSYAYHRAGFFSHAYHRAGSFSHAYHRAGCFSYAYHRACSFSHAYHRASRPVVTPCSKTLPCVLIVAAGGELARFVSAN